MIAPKLTGLICALRFGLKADAPGSRDLRIAKEIRFAASSDAGSAFDPSLPASMTPVPSPMTCERPSKKVGASRTDG